MNEMEDILVYSSLMRNELLSNNFRQNFPTSELSSILYTSRIRFSESFRVAERGPEFFRITQWCGKPNEWYSRRGIEIIGNIINPKEGGRAARLWARGVASLPLGINL